MSDDNDEKVMLLSLADLERMGITQGSDALRELEKKGLFPQRRRFGVRQICWLSNEIYPHLKNLPKATDKPVPGRAQAAATMAASGRKLGRPTNAERAAREAKRKAGGGS
jgi:predicted DNA-binding transcriptional regulator AlpA